MNRYSMVKRVQGLLFLLAAAGALAALFSVTPALAADMDANAKALAKLDDDWSKAAATRDADRVASFYAEDAIAYPPDEPAAIGRAAAKKVWRGISQTRPLRSRGRRFTRKWPRAAISATRPAPTKTRSRGPTASRSARRESM